MLLPACGSIWQRTSSSWQSPMSTGGSRAARLTRAQFERWFDNRAGQRLVMEACGSAHHWARGSGARHRGDLLPAQYVRAYVRRNKTDAADASRAARGGTLRRYRSGEGQVGRAAGLQALHRTRSLWMGTRTSRINALRGFCRELGIAREGARRPGADGARPGRRAIAVPRCSGAPCSYCSRRYVCSKRASRNWSVSSPIGPRVASLHHAAEAFPAWACSPHRDGGRDLRRVQHFAMLATSLPGSG